MAKSDCSAMRVDAFWRRTPLDIQPLWFFLARRFKFTSNCLSRSCACVSPSASTYFSAFNKSHSVVSYTAQVTSSVLLHSLSQKFISHVWLIFSKKSSLSAVFYACKTPRYCQLLFQKLTTCNAVKSNSGWIIVSSARKVWKSQATVSFNFIECCDSWKQYEKFANS